MAHYSLIGTCTSGISIMVSTSHNYPLAIINLQLQINQLLKGNWKRLEIKREDGKILATINREEQ